MKKGTVALTLVGVLFIFYTVYTGIEQQRFDTVVKSDFKNLYPDFVLLDYQVEDGDFVTRSIKIKFKKPNDDLIHEELWSYWDSENGWELNQK